MPEMNTILISTAAIVVLLAVANIVVVILVLRRTKDDISAWRSVVEQSLIHIKSTTAIEAVNAASALEYNHKVIEESEVEEPQPEKKEPTVLKDPVTGKEYEVIGGDTDGLY